MVRRKNGEDLCMSCGVKTVTIEPLEREYKDGETFVMQGRMTSPFPTTLFEGLEDPDHEVPFGSGMFVKASVLSRAIKNFQAQGKASFSTSGSAHVALPPHIVDEDTGCAQQPHANSSSCIMAHQICEDWAWVHWASVQQTGHHYTIEVKHTYPIDIEADLLRWVRVLGDLGCKYTLSLEQVEKT